MSKLRIDSTVFNSHASADTLKIKAQQSARDLLEFAEQLAEAANHSTTAPYAQFSVRNINLQEGAPSKGFVDFAILHALMDEKEVVLPAPATAEHSAANDAAPYSPAIAKRQAPPASNNGTGNGTKGMSTSTVKMFKEGPPQTVDRSPSNEEQNGHHEAPENSAKVEKRIGAVDNNILDFSFAVTKNPFNQMVAACMLRTDTTLTQEDGVPSFIRSGQSGDIQDVDSMHKIADFLFSWVHENVPEKDQPKFRENCQKLGLVGGEPAIGFTAKIA